MYRSPSEISDQRLEIERNDKYRGAARIKLDVLHFPEHRKKEIRRRNVERLKGIFRTESIRRLEPRNRIPVVVDELTLDDALQMSGISAEHLLSNPRPDPPLLEFPTSCQLMCLHGLHRIQAARETLPATDAWWVAEIFLTDLTPQLATALAEEYANEEKPSDGVIYCKIREYERQGDLSLQLRWKARLADYSRRGLEQLTRYRNGKLANAFDKLIAIPGLWPSMRLSAIPDLVSMKCDEEILNYLEHIRAVWNGLFNEKASAVGNVNQAIVQALQLRAPKYSRNDVSELEDKVLHSRTFDAFSKSERKALWDRLCELDCLVPSLYTFFEDVKYLEASAKCLKRLVSLSGDTLRTALYRAFTSVSQLSKECAIEIAESAYSYASEQPSKHFEIGYLQLWLFAMRHYTEISLEPKRRKGISSLARPGKARSNGILLSELASLAKRLGFKSNYMDALSQTSTDYEVAHNALLEARNPDRFRYNSEIFEASVVAIIELFRKATPLPYENSDPIFVTDMDAPEHLCGFPNEHAQRYDRRYLFMLNFCISNEQMGENITSLFVRRSVFVAFFGKPPEIDTANLKASKITERSPDHNENSERSTSHQRYVNFSGSERGPLESDRLEQERLKQAQGEQEILEQKQQRLLEEERYEQEKLDLKSPEPERLERQELLERESSSRGEVQISILLRDRGVWREQETIKVRNGNSSEIERMAKNNIREGIQVFDTELMTLSAKECFQVAMDDRTQTLLLIPREGLRIDDELLNSASEIRESAKKKVLGRKRIATDDISRAAHWQKKQITE